MNIERLVNAIRSLGNEPVIIPTDCFGWSDIIKQPEIHDYLRYCVTADGFSASGVGILGHARLIEENMEGVSPGGRIRKFGYLAIAISIGGNAIVLSSVDGHAYWADHSSYSDDVELSYKDRDTGEWHYSPWSAETVQKSLVHLSDNIEAFLLDLFGGKLEERLDRLDN